MMNKVIHAVFSTDSLPVFGGATGALTQARNLIFPSIETILYTIIVAIVGATCGYLVKLFLDWLFSKCKK